MKEKLIIEPCAGLGNRIYAVTSAMRLAEDNNMDLEIVWKREGPCYARMNALFDCNRIDAPIHEVTEMTKRHVKDWIGTAYGYHIRKVLRKGKVFIPTEELDRFAVDGWISLNPDQSYYIKSTGPLVNPDDCDYSVLQPSEVVQKRAENVWREIRESTIGVHIRRTDHLGAIENSPTKEFIRIIDKEILGGGSSFFVCSDDSAEIVNLERRYGNRILTYKGRKSRSNQDGIIDAMVDLYGLSRCSKIIGSAGSTFSQIAARIGNVELITVSKNGNN